MFDPRAAGVVGAYVVGMLGPLRPSESWSPAAIKRIWLASSRSDRLRIGLSVTCFMLHLFAIVMLMDFWGRAPSSDVSLSLALLECFRLDRDSILVRMTVCTSNKTIDV